MEAVRSFWLNEKGPAGLSPSETVRFHHVSTDEVFGMLGPDDPAFSETTPYSPNSPYSASKASSDHLVRAYGHTYSLPYTITNCSNNYGPYQFPEKVVPWMILNALEGQPLPIYGDGQQVRDWLYVEDHCEAIHLVLKKGASGETYASAAATSRNSPDTTICEILDECAVDSPYKPHARLIRFVTDRPGHDRRYAIDFSKIQRELGWQPRQSLESGLLKTVQWYLSHPEWIEAVRKQRDYQGWLSKNTPQRRGEMKEFSAGGRGTRLFPLPHISTQLLCL